MIDKKHKSPADDLVFVLFARQSHACCIEIVKSGHLMCQFWMLLDNFAAFISKRNLSQSIHMCLQTIHRACSVQRMCFHEHFESETSQRVFGVVLRDSEGFVYLADDMLSCKRLRLVHLTERRAVVHSIRIKHVSMFATHHLTLMFSKLSLTR